MLNGFHRHAHFDDFCPSEPSGFDTDDGLQVEFTSRSVYWHISYTPQCLSSDILLFVLVFKGRISLYSSTWPGT